ncbi:winged helix-turn-helix transcriptional regulator [Listeria ivanovii]|uniref:Helix-turn-helix transcriptional regulator n=2 Tax=Listeria ivanovii TaxID=1638 RepID=A0ABS1G626_LISIV|nr:helix-turn-helix domain-containing protein [Listeria ivanovii]EFR95764.1 transcriptional regulator, HxlR family protein [Listeria ivanovii FSL F6-596]MBC2254944.1 helix-turn-helix transcriptional regulator [Listeria ivanovii]MBK1962334.1 helix-turn-helix transcriptional regulator [Listeria ivanovii subsp. londoniensis]MBK1967112.1 helix-turn-helix transcriptional regulator [Listeria ivanovii subsp. londoniensis]MBK1985049.1 helix-turn-helix transcriptional regulator [Listeria ivanovii subsp
MHPNENVSDDMRLRELALPLLGKWVPFILILLSERPYHFAELERTMTGVSRKVLNENLLNLQASGILHKSGESSTGFPVYYSLTELGESSLFILENIKSWLRENEELIRSNRKNFFE